LIRLGEADEAEQLAREAVSRAWATEYVNLRALSQEALAGLLHRSGRTSEAAEALRKAISVYEAKGNVVSAAAAHKALSEMETATDVPGT
jgi:uncharacterized protein HemY